MSYDKILFAIFIIVCCIKFEYSRVNQGAKNLRNCLCAQNNDLNRVFDCPAPHFEYKICRE